MTKKLKYNPEPPSLWNERILLSCPSCNHEYSLEQLILEKKYCEYYSTDLYYACCPDCGKEHVVFG